MPSTVNLSISENSELINIRIESDEIINVEAIELSPEVKVAVVEGTNGKDGKDGTNGANGKNGTNGIDGDSITVNGIAAVSGNITLETSDIPESAVDYKYVTDAEKTVISNTSGTNTGDETASRIGILINGSAAATPNDADLVATAESSVLKKITWTNVKAFLKTYFDTIYTTTSAVATQISTALSSYLTSATAASTYQVILTATNFGAFINGLTSKTTPIDADSISIVDSAASNVQKKVSLTNFLAYLKTYFDTLYRKNITVDSVTTTASHTGSTAETILGSMDVPANTFTTNDEMIITFLGNTLGVAGTKEFKIYINTVANLTGTPIQLGRVTTTAGAFGVRFIRTFEVDSPTLLKNALSETTNFAADWRQDSPYTTFTTDLTVQQYIVLTGKLTNSGDTILMQSLRIKRSRE